MRVIQRRSAQIIHLLYLVVQIFLTYKRRLNILHDTKRKFLSIKLSNRSAYYIFTLLFLLYFFDYVDRTIVTSVAPFIREEWDLTDMQSGLLLSVVN